MKSRLERDLIEMPPAPLGREFCKKETTNAGQPAVVGSRATLAVPLQRQ
jgi:hypothetical protein